MSIIEAAMKRKPEAKKEHKHKALKEFHAKELHDGSYHIAKHDGKGGMKEASSPDLAGVQEAMEQHMQAPDAEQPEAPAAAPAPQDAE